MSFPVTRPRSPISGPALKFSQRQVLNLLSSKSPIFLKSISSKITDIEAYVFYPDPSGKLIREKVERKQIFDQKSVETNNLNYVSFTFPNLKKGSVIEYTYTQTNKKSIYLEPWIFQDVLPTALSRITAVFPAYMKINYHTLLVDSVEKDSSLKKYYKTQVNETTRSFTMRNIRSFKTEPLMGSLKDNLQRLEFDMAPPGFVSSMLNKFGTNWRVYNFYLLRARHFGHLFQEKVGIAASFTDSLKKMARTEDKISAAYRYVQKNVECNGEQVFYFDSVEECLKTKTPSSAEMNFLLLNLLRKAGVSCYPLLVSTHENGNPDESFPILSQFNGLDLLVYDSLLFYDVDCTQKDLSFKIPPYNILNTYAYLLDFDKYGWIFVTDNRISMIKETSIQAEMDSQGGLKGYPKAE